MRGFSKGATFFCLNSYHNMGRRSLSCWFLAQILFTAELRRRLPGDCGVAAAAVHPGEVMTDVVRSLPGLMQSAYRFFMRPFCLTPAQGTFALLSSVGEV